MKKLFLVAILLVTLTGCKKVTFTEYYDCEQAFRAKVTEAGAKYSKTSTKYLQAVDKAQKEYEQCLVAAED